LTVSAMITALSEPLNLDHPQTVANVPTVFVIPRRGVTEEIRFPMQFHCSLPHATLALLAHFPERT
jgi:hypothetical protein